MVSSFIMFKFIKEKRKTKMGLHTKSNRETRKRKYAEQFAKTAENKKRKAGKREKNLKNRR